jgi:hypothetical protein
LYIHFLVCRYGLQTDNFSLRLLSYFGRVVAPFRRVWFDCVCRSTWHDRLSVVNACVISTLIRQQNARVLDGMYVSALPNILTNWRSATNSYCCFELSFRVYFFLCLQIRKFCSPLYFMSPFRRLPPSSSYSLVVSSHNRFIDILTGVENCSKYVGVGVRGGEAG